MVDVGGEQQTELTASVVVAVVRARGQDDDDVEVGARRAPQLRGEDPRDLRRPEKLALEVHELLGRAQRPHVRLEDPEVALRQRVVDVVRNRPDELRAHVSGGLGVAHVELLAGDLSPAKGDMRRDVSDERALDAGSRVVPADTCAGGVHARIEPVAGERRQVDAADVGDAAVDHRELFVMAVHRPLFRVEGHANARSAHEPIALLAHAPSRRSEKRKRRACPRDHPHVDALGERSEQLVQRRAAAGEVERRVEVPAGKQHVALRAFEIGLEARERRLAVDEELDAVAVAGRRVAGAPQGSVRRRVPRTPPAVPVQAAPVMCDDGTLDGVADGIVQTVDMRDRHRARRVSAQTPARTR